MLALGPKHARPVLQRLSAARVTVLRLLSADTEPVTVGRLAEQLGQHPNTVREHLDALVADGRVERVRATPTGRGRPAWLYQAVVDTELGDFEGVGTNEFGDGPEYASLAIALIDQVASESPDPLEVSRNAGERWGRSLISAPLRSDAADPDDDTGASTAGPSPVANDQGEPVEATANGPTTTAPDQDEAADVVLGMLSELRFTPQRTDEKGVYRLTTCPLLDAARRNPEVVCQVHLGIVRGVLEELGADPDAAELTAFAEPGACLLTLPGRR